mmetsp:Transcript_78258/g.207688  ORF Transcript_78258/g.207688 Transcript_78258/m.207688 type:complete len:303 (-) Transcript_78258:145-1053(-)|eukprot:CAMPEP_0171191286 /NCGR_PEP_ID=MMETSP0790-20130122/19287_1 /TAXON_ID=2925 /ORGANISM="Alexandrium catenella, Strain OF101" /LENGTH=302 /DNA_ID=CAMNT_0011656431 /DNA_START=44 /DNA_END=952 /DNA_ORIENTATION=-
MGASQSLDVPVVSLVDSLRANRLDEYPALQRCSSWKLLTHMRGSGTRGAEADIMQQTARCDTHQGSDEVEVLFGDDDSNKILSAFADALQHNIVIRSLFVQCQCVTKEVVLALTVMLRNNNHLEDLEVESLRGVFGESDALAEAMDHNACLRSLSVSADVQGEEYTIDLGHRIEEALARNQQALATARALGQAARSDGTRAFGGGLDIGIAVQIITYFLPPQGVIPPAMAACIRGQRYWRVAARPGGIDMADLWSTASDEGGEAETDSAGRATAFAATAKRKRTTEEVDEGQEEEVADADGQ